MDGCMRAMPRYECHKVVHALKIAEILPPADDETPAMIVPADEGYAPFPIAGEFLERHRPEVGGYYVVYRDGYASYSPAKAFEEGYTRV